MKGFVATPLVLLACSGSTLAVSPVQKVIELLQSMAVKGKQGKHEEQVQFAAYKQFCDDSTVEKKRAVQEAGQTIESLTADISKYVSDTQELTKEIAGHDSDIAAWSGDKKAAAKVRELEKADYDALHQDYSESVDAIQRAIVVLKKQAHDRPQASLTQVDHLKSLTLIPAEAKKAIDLFLQQAADPLDVSAPDAAGYDFQSHGIIGILEKLNDKFIEERSAAEKAEMNSRHAFQMMIQDLTAQVDQATTDRGQKAGIKAKKLQHKADAKGELGDTQTTKGADEKYLVDMTSTCDQKASDYEARQQLRSEEIEAISKAIDILSGGAVKGNADKYLPSLVQKKGSSLAQLRSAAVGAPQQRAAAFLRERASQLNSRVLSTLSLRVADDPFAKVKKMIKDLLVRLLEEANEEAEHKGWCDTELSTNEQTRKEKSEAVEVLHAEIDQLQASIAKLGEETGQLSTEVAELNAAMAKGTQIRQDEKKKNEQTIKDASDAQSAVAQALVVLKEFYAKSGDATALVQQTQPEIFDSPYTGMGGESGGVIGLLEVVESDFARLEAETTAGETTSQKMYDEFMTDSKVDNAAKSKDIEHKTIKKQEESQAMTTKKSDLEGTQAELDAALSYFDKLKPSCVDSGVSYDDRVARRKEEIESLQEALRILNGEDLP